MPRDNEDVGGQEVVSPTGRMQWPIYQEVGRRKGDPDFDRMFRRVVGVVALGCLVIMLLFMVIGRDTSGRKSAHPRDRSATVPVAEEHDSLPMPPGHLDRG